MGTYHLLGGAKIRVFYPGNTKTCGRCHQAPTYCPGGGLAKACGERGGDRVTLFQHMKHLWNKINYDPDKDYSADIEETDDDDNSPILQQISDESFMAQGDGSGHAATDETEEQTDVIEQDSEGDLESESEGEEEKEEQNDEGETMVREVIIPGLEKPLTKSQKKRIRRNKRKHATAPPVSNNPKVTKLSTTSPSLIENSSLVTKLIKKYSTSDQNNDEKIEESEANSSSSLGSSLGPSSLDQSKPSVSSSVASSPPSSSVHEL